MNELEFKASRLRTQIKISLRNDYFFDAEKYRAELAIIEKQITNEK